MAYEVQEPEKTENYRESYRLDHPAFGQISVTKVKGHQYLYGSEFSHHTSMCIKITQSFLERSLSRDSMFPTDNVAEVYLSEAQWATFVSSIGIYAGVPCTIRSIGKKLLPGVVLRDTTEDYENEISGTVAESITRLKNLKCKMEADLQKVPKSVKDSLLADICRAIQSLEQNLPFVVEQFGEHIENRIEKAKVEINAYAMDVSRANGLNLEQRAESPMIEDGTKHVNG